MNISKDEFLIENILKNNIFNHDKKLNELEILFKKIENDN